MNLIEHYITLALERAGVKISPDMRHEIASIEQGIIDNAKRQLREEAGNAVRRTLDHALNSGDGTYRP